MINFQDYCVADPDVLETLVMLLFQDMMDHNLRVFKIGAHYERS
jgi:hypothetical protein